MNKCLNCGIETNNKKFCSISCQNTFQNSERADKRFGLFKEFIVNCEKCGKEIVIKEREKLFPQKDKYYCDRICANSRMHSEETKLKIKESIIEFLKIKEKATKEAKQKKDYIKKEKEMYMCKNCKKEFFVSDKRERIFCSHSCSTTWRNIYEGNGRKAGLASVKSQSEKRRSRNEIYFSELCKNHFKKVLTNEPMFNGWDADVIIEDIKTAVLWNGKWHYEKIKKEHSVIQVQNRERIKIKEIEGRGYKVYIIKDMGKYKKEFVEEEFNKFLLSL